MKRTDKEIIEAMEFIKSKFNGELPYKFGTFECAKIMAEYKIAIDYAHSSIQLKENKEQTFEEYLKEIDKHFIYEDFLNGEFTYTIGDYYRIYKNKINQHL